MSWSLLYKVVMALVVVLLVAVADFVIVAMVLVVAVDIIIAGMVEVVDIA